MAALEAWGLGRLQRSSQPAGLSCVPRAAGSKGGGVVWPHTARRRTAARPLATARPHTAAPSPPRQAASAAVHPAEAAGRAQLAKEEEEEEDFKWQLAAVEHRQQELAHRQQELAAQMAAQMAALEAEIAALKRKQQMASVSESGQSVEPRGQAQQEPAREGTECLRQVVARMLPQERAHTMRGVLRTLEDMARSEVEGGEQLELEEVWEEALQRDAALAACLASSAGWSRSEAPVQMAALSCLLATTSALEYQITSKVSIPEAWGDAVLSPAEVQAMQCACAALGVPCEVVGLEEYDDEDLMGVLVLRPDRMPATWLNRSNSFTEQDWRDARKCVPSVFPRFRFKLCGIQMDLSQLHDAVMYAGGRWADWERVAEELGLPPGQASALQRRYAQSVEPLLGPAMWQARGDWEWKDGRWQDLEAEGTAAPTEE